MGRILHYGIVLMLIAVISGGILGSLNNATAPIIELKKQEATKMARKEVLPQAIKFNENEKIKIDDLEFIPGYNAENKEVGYVVSISSNGYGGEIKFVLGIDENKKIAGLKIVDSKETPGLGAKINNLDWQKTWLGRDKNYEFNKSVDAFAGATISPRAVYTGIKKSLEVIEKVVK
ncbi:MAG: nitrogen fixation protein RnfG [Fusobacteriia bacterium 4572_132]|nr:MAG: nitrogen fixation protein RnfG [Fusobacteriia bacterium 4572_132]